MYQLIIVDDEKNIREGLAECYPWRELGFDVAAVLPDGKSALNYIEHCCVDIVLSDIRMPQMGGLEFAKYLYYSHPSIVVVLLSGFAEFEYAKEALRYGVKEYILKPVQYEEILWVFGNIKEELDIKRGIRKIEEPYSGYYDQIAGQIIDYLKTSYKTASLEEAAKLIHLSPNYLSKIFKRKTGKNFSEYLLEIKMERAAALLRDINLKTYEIAEEVGYDNPKNFTRAFKQYSGKTPREFREQDSSL